MHKQQQQSLRNSNSYLTVIKTDHDFTNKFPMHINNSTYLGYHKA